MYRVYVLLMIFFAAALPASASTMGFNLFRSGGNGTVLDLTTDPYRPTFVLAGSDAHSWRTVDTSYLTLALEPHSYPSHSNGWKVSGNWAYLSQNSSPYWDSFGYVINGVKTQLTRNYGALSQSGVFNFFVSPGQAFGWYVSSRDDCCGRGIASVASTISPNYSQSPAPVPLPAAGWMILAGLGGLGMVRRHVRRAA